MLGCPANTWKTFQRSHKVPYCQGRLFQGLSGQFTNYVTLILPLVYFTWSRKDSNGTLKHDLSQNSKISNISTKYNCDLRAFPLNSVKHSCRNSHQISFGGISDNSVCFCLLMFVFCPEWLLCFFLTSHQKRKTPCLLHPIITLHFH